MSKPYIKNLGDFGMLVQGGVIQNDRGNGSAGPLWLGEYDSDKASEWDGTSATLVTEDEDPDAWRLAREAFEAEDLPGEPEHVAVGYSDGGSNPHQCIWAG